LKGIVSKHYRAAAAKVAAELYTTHLEDLFTRKQSGESFTHPTFTVELPLLNL
jgi:hypothetical protein